MEKKWDVFISHASEDKDSVVRELADNLGKMGVKVWFDEFSLRLGDSLSKSIDEGLALSNFGLVIISKSFLNKKWPDYEYRSLLSKEDNNKKSILPIWHNVSQKEIKEFSLYLADKLAIDTSRLPIDKIALKIVEVVRPDIYQSIKSYHIFKEYIKNAEMINIEFTSLKPQEKPQSKLSKQQEVRVRNIYYGIGKVLELPINDHIYQFELDSLPEREIQTWEIMNLCFLEFIDKYQIEETEQKIEVSALLIGFSIGQLYKVKYISDKQKSDLYKLWTEYYYEF